jgi:hypothetical protein
MGDSVNVFHVYPLSYIGQSAHKGQKQSEYLPGVSVEW